MRLKALVVVLVAALAATILLLGRSAADTGTANVDAKWLMDLLVMLATIAIAYFAYSTDKAYHRIADVAGKLGTIAQQQLEILSAQDEPIISAKADLHVAGPNTDTLAIANSGPPITEISVERAEVYEVTYWMPDPPFKREVKRFGTIGYYPGSSLTGQGSGTIYQTMPSSYMALMASIHSTIDKQFNGYNTLFNFQRFFRIEYRNRGGHKRTRWFSVNEFGSREIREQEGRDQFEIVRTTGLQGHLFVFYKMGIDEFWNIVSNIAPQTDAHQRGFFHSALNKLQSLASYFLSARGQ